MGMETSPFFYLSFEGGSCDVVAGMDEGNGNPWKSGSGCSHGGLYAQPVPFPGDSQAQEISEGVDWDFVEECWVRPEREFQYMALGYLNKVKGRLGEEDLEGLGGYITRKSWWDSVDQFPALLGDILRRDPQALPVMLDWSLAEDFWLRRAAILHQLLKKERTDRAALEKILSNNLGSKEFFINKAMGWALRDFSKTDPRWVANFMETHAQGLSSLTIREGSKYLP